MARLFDGVEKDIKKGLDVHPLLKPLFENGLIDGLIEQLKERIVGRIWSWVNTHADDGVFVVEYRFIGIKIISMTIRVEKLRPVLEAMLNDETPEKQAQHLV